MYLINRLSNPISFVVNSYIPIKTTQNLLDVAILVVAFCSAYLLRFDFSLRIEDVQLGLTQLLYVIPIECLLLYILGIHKFIWRYVSIRESKRILLALLASSFPLVILRVFLSDESGWARVPFSIILLNYCLASIGIISLRVLRREIYENKRRSLTTNAVTQDKKSVLLIGAGRAGVMTLSEIKSRGDINIDVKGFVDDDPAKLGAVINGVKVLGTTKDLPKLVNNHLIDHVIISMAQATREDFQRILETCRSVPVKVRAIPGLFELLQEKVTVSRIRDIEIEDLLGRSPIQLDEKSIKLFLDQKIVMVTGAGGSIGSELVRQLALCHPQKMILVERSEFALFQIEREITTNFPDIQFVAILADICDEARMRKIFEKFGPQVIFHAAAHKHVPMMEFNSTEALKNNALGTNLLGQLAGQFGTEAFVLISTDKAVNPTSIMGASKRIAELFIQDLNNRYPTRFVAVRFGNVMGSNGSVIPTFREQIRKGGPVTVTHPEMERFFMTIPEATQLVLQAGAIGRGGEILILDMGKPVKILDLARETIKLSGLRPEIDMKIVFTGIRRGEKLFEELETDKEKLSKTIHPKIFVGKIDPYPSQKIFEMTKEIQIICNLEDDSAIRTLLTFYIPESKLEIEFDNLPILVNVTDDLSIANNSTGLMVATAR